MKSTAIFFVIFAGSVFCSCSKAEITATPVSQTRAGDNEVSLLFTKDNLSESQAIEFATHFLKKTPFFIHGMYFISFLAIISSITSLLRYGIADLRFIFAESMSVLPVP